ncbi:hypothetical protein SLA2020_239080 [Shorea laevis]
MTGAATWSREEEKAFENAIAIYWVEDNSEEQKWENMASMVPTKSLEELKQHYNILEEDVSAIEAGTVPLPSYAGENAIPSANDFHAFSGAAASDKRLCSGYGRGFFTSRHESGGHTGKGGSRSDQERKKGIPWTEEEHRLFLLGLDKFGKGDWRSISRNFVISRTPTQVASHAQKYFIRLNSMNRDGRRSSIHDITSVNSGDTSCPHAPIIGQQRPNTNPSGTGAMGPPAKHRAREHLQDLGMYEVPFGHPVAAPGHMASAVGTPVMLPPGHYPPPYMVPVAYPMAPPIMHQ